MITLFFSFSYTFCVDKFQRGKNLVRSSINILFSSSLRYCKTRCSKMLSTVGLSSPLSVTCVVELCEFVSFGLCNCCKQNLCIDHLNEHAKQWSTNLHNSLERIDCLLLHFKPDEIDKQLEIQQLHQWYEDSRKLIDEFYEKKRNELIEKMDEKYRKQLDQMRNQILDLILKKGGSQLHIDQLSNSLNMIEEGLKKNESIPLKLPEIILNESSSTREIKINGKDCDHSIEIPSDSKSKSENSSEQRKSRSRSSKKKGKSSRNSRRSRSRSVSSSSHRKSRSPRKSNFKSSQDSISFHFIFIDFYRHQWINFL